MKRESIRICILRVGGTNCDAETKRAFTDLGVKTEIVHLNQLVKKQRLPNYSALVFPGGFSYGDYVRAGAIWAKGLLAKLQSELRRFTEEKKPILGICNGFQVLVEAGLLPGFDGISPYPEVALATNRPIGYHCRWIYVKCESQDTCIFTQKIPKGKVLRMPVAHAEGRLLLATGREHQTLKRLYDADQLVLRYCHADGQFAGGRYPVNPNGAFHDIAGICNPAGTVFGLMPHPERAYYGWQLPDWTRRTKVPDHGDGKFIFQSMVEYLCHEF